jgi:hypothetical protein
MVGNLHHYLAVDLVAVAATAAAAVLPTTRETAHERIMEIRMNVLNFIVANFFQW